MTRVRGLRSARRANRSASFTALLASAVACGREPVPPSPHAGTLGSGPPNAVAAPVPAPPPLTSVAEPLPSATAPVASPAGAAPALFDAAGKLLPQLEDEPSVDSPFFERHLELLFRAIVQDDPELARTFFFPVEAYEQVKAIEEPGKDWRARLWKHFVRDVHRYHEELGGDPSKAKLVGLEPRSERKKWMKPHSEGNRLGYWRMTRNQLRFTDARDQTRSFELTSLISWRGEWYVVHLHGFD